MRCSYVLRNNWLKYSHGIADYAYHSTDNTCVYYQMTKLLLDPPTGRPTQFVRKQRTSEQALFRFFQQYIRDHALKGVYEDFTMTTGVSAELLAGLCNEVGRNMYAYDADNKLFHSVLTHASKNYCPVVFYKMSGHCYLINDKHVIRSVAENSKKAVTKIISSSLVEERTTTNDVAVQHMESFDVSTAATLPEGVYLVKQFNIDQEAFEFIKKYQVIPSTKTRKSNIVQLKFQQGLADELDWKKRKYVSICIDVTHKESYTYAQIKM
jgi:hypothetical protein